MSSSTPTPRQPQNTAAFCASTIPPTRQLQQRHTTASKCQCWRGTTLLPARRQAGGRKQPSTMQLPPPNQYEPPLPEEERAPPDYKWDPDFPGTLKPGTVEDNYPLARVLASDVYENMVYEELDMDERCQDLFEPDEDFLEWLMKEGRLIPRNTENEDIEMEPDSQMDGITEDELGYGDDDSKMIAYYSRQGEGSVEGSSSDFGGFSESSADVVDAGF